MARWMLLAAWLLLALPARAAEEAEDCAGSLDHQGRSREFLVHLPPGHRREQPVPLVLALHGGGGRADRLNRATSGSMNREADRRGWVVAYPQGIDRGWNDGRPLSSRRDRRRAGVDDVAFLGGLIDHLAATHGIDRQRVFAAGISNGGFMSLRLACDLSGKIAAIGVVTASHSRALEARKPEHPVSVIFINGTNDPLVPFGGGQVRVLGRERGAILSTADSVAWWVRHNGCSTTPELARLPDRNESDGCRVEVESYRGGRRGTRVALYTVRGGGHTWPGGTQYLPRAVVGRVCRDFDACEALFGFFAEHARRPPAPTGDR